MDDLVVVLSALEVEAVEKLDVLDVEWADGEEEGGNLEDVPVEGVGVGECDG